MPVDVILGLQWGDEGKGKIVDLLSKDYYAIARFQGGPNAGHTIIIGKKKFILHQIPSGMLRPEMTNVIGCGVILDPTILRREIETLEAEGVEVKSRLLISRRANLIMPTHRLLDAHRESGDSKIGSTKKGIGPTYQDKTGRFGLRIGDIFHPNFMEWYTEKKERHLKLLKGLSADCAFDDSQWLEDVQYLKGLKYVDSEVVINQWLEEGKHILAEGAQGTLLDIDFGTYPYVTSSNTIASSVCSGLGIAPQHIRKVFGVFKAYTTRVGEGPFPTELNNELGEDIRQRGKEFGSTTGRPRRTGWLDLPALNYAIMINGVTHLILMKMDVLDGLPEIGVGVDYHDHGGNPAGFADLSFGTELYPDLEMFEGWPENSTSVFEYNHLPSQAKDYLLFIEEHTHKRISIISTGPERDQTIYL